MWILQGPKKTFRLTAGSVKTVGRSTRADFIVDAALVSRVHCRFESRTTCGEPRYETWFGAECQSALRCS